jgi:hypothetical protein
VGTRIFEHLVLHGAFASLVLGVALRSNLRVAVDEEGETVGCLSTSITTTASGPIASGLFIFNPSTPVARVDLTFPYTIGRSNKSTLIINDPRECRSGLDRLYKG